MGFLVLRGLHVCAGYLQCFICEQMRRGWCTLQGGPLEWSLDGLATM